MAAILNSWTVQHLRKDLETVSNDSGKYLRKNLPAEGRGSTGAPGEVEVSQV